MEALPVLSPQKPEPATRIANLRKDYKHKTVHV